MGSWRRRSLQPDKKNVELSWQRTPVVISGTRSCRVWQATFLGGMLENAVIRGTFEHLFNAMHFQLAIVPGQPTPATQHGAKASLGQHQSHVRGTSMFFLRFRVQLGLPCETCMSTKLASISQVEEVRLKITLPRVTRPTAWGLCLGHSLLHAQDSKRTEV